jgi:hypothetical protein
VPQMFIEELGHEPIDDLVCQTAPRRFRSCRGPLPSLQRRSHRSAKPWKSSIATRPPES